LHDPDVHLRRQPFITTKEIFEMAKDLVCGMTVEENAKISSTHNGKTYGFCSAGCKAKFDKEPEHFVSASEKGVKPTGGHSCC